MSDDGWSDDEKPAKSAIQYEMYECSQDFVPETKEFLNLCKFDLVYVFKKDPSGIWEGETKGVYGRFPSSHVRPLKPIGDTKFLPHK